MNLLLDPVWWNWYLLGVALMCLELLLPGVFLFWLGLGALATGTVVQFVSGAFYWPYQWLIFGIFSLLSVFLVRKLVKLFDPKGDPTLNRRLDQLVGRSATLTEPIRNGRGRIRLDDTIWVITGPDLDPGNTVVVTGAKDSILLVEKA